MPFDPVHDINWLLERSPGVELLYKFRSARDDRHQAALRAGKLYIGEALALNDPFDSKPKEFLHRSTAEEANAYREAVSVSTDRLLFNVLWTAWLVAGSFWEERDLVAEFCDRYRAYQRVVPMLLPWRGPAGKRLHPMPPGSPAAT